jgi:Putative amidoligase enzyme
VKATWGYIQKYYLVGKTTLCSTHVHISAIFIGDDGERGMDLESMKRIAQCVIHWEPALEALTPEERRGNMYARSNWIDNPRFKAPIQTRSIVITQIGECRSRDEIIDLMSPKLLDRFWAWNFRAMNKYGTIEFRKGSASLNGEQVLAWSELALCFVQSAMQTDINSLGRVPANVAALKRFLGGAEKVKALKLIFDGKRDDASVQPELIYKPDMNMEIMLRRKLREDNEKQQKLAREWRP